MCNLLPGQEFLAQISFLLLLLFVLLFILTEEACELLYPNMIYILLLRADNFWQDAWKAEWSCHQTFYSIRSGFLVFVEVCVSRYVRFFKLSSVQLRDSLVQSKLENIQAAYVADTLFGVVKSA